MFAFLRGIVAYKPAGAIALDVGGAGYEIHVPDSTHRKLALNQEATLLTYCHIREDSFQIFGFLREEDRALFKMLLSISQIGPKSALAILSALPVGELLQAVEENNVKAFERVSGVGKKTAQRIILEMKAKLGQDAELSAILGEPEADASPEEDDVMAALCSLGCTTNEAKRAVGIAHKQLGENASTEELIKAALRSMARI